MSTYLLVDKITQDWTEMWISMSHHASASRCDKKQLFQTLPLLLQFRL